MKIRLWPAPILKQKAVAVPAMTDEVRTLLTKMQETMKRAKGAGLAAPQVGELLRLVVVADEQGDTVSMANPEIVELGREKKLMREGCLSFPGFWENIERSTTVTVRFLATDGETKTLMASGLLAHAIQHEVEHLDGMVFIDHLSKFKRDVMLKRFKKSQVFAGIHWKNYEEEGVHREELRNQHR